MNWSLVILIPAFSIVLLLGWRRWLRAHVGDERFLPLAAGVWAPLLASAGFLGLLAAAGGDDGVFTARVVGLGPLLLAVVVGVRLIRNRPLPPVEVGWPLMGVILVLVASAGRIPHTVGLLVSALALVLVWFNSMPADEVETVSADQLDVAPGALTTATLAGAAVGLASWFAPVEARDGLVLWLASVAAGVVISVATIGGGVHGVRAAGWFAVTLPSLGLGVLGHERLLQMFDGGPLAGPLADPDQVRQTADLLASGLIILLVSLVLGVASRWSGRRSRAAGGLITVIAVALWIAG